MASPERKWCITAALLLASIYAGLAPSPASGQVRIHLLMVADTRDPGIGDSCRADQAMIETLFRAHVPGRQLAIQTLSGLSVRPQMILRAAGSLAIAPARDTVVFYYSGHGQYDPANREHVLVPGRQAVRLASVRAALEQIRPRLAVLITDTCSEIARVPPSVGAPAGRDRLSPAFHSLFVEPSGVIVVSCTRPGQLARGDSNGGYFTKAFSQSLFAGMDQRFTWEGLLGEINQTVRADFRDSQQTAYIAARHDSGQPTPVVDHSNNADGGGGIRFGLSAIQTARSIQLGGVEVYRVWAGYPATRLRGLVDGRTYSLVGGRDVITHVNGQAVITEPELRQAINRSPQRMILRVHDTQTGTKAEYEADLGTSGAGGGGSGGSVPGSSPIRLGVNGAPTQVQGTTGVLITYVQGGTPATQLSGADGRRYSLVAYRDVVTQANGQMVATLAELVDAVRRSPREMTLTVYDRQTGQTAEYTARLRE